jgi:subtilisin family serine protease
MQGGKCTENKLMLYAHCPTNEKNSYIFNFIGELFMHTQQKSSMLFRIVVAIIVFVLVFSQFVGKTQAQGENPPVKERIHVTPVSLGEVQNYFGRLADIKGNIGVVVELQDTPSVLIYAKGTSQSKALATNQAVTIQGKQASFMQAVDSQGIKVTELYRTQKVYNGIWMQVDSKDLAKLAAIPGVKAIHPMVPKTLDHTTSVSLIGAPQVWGGTTEYQGDAIKVGVIDTGIDYIHTNFGGPGDYTGQDFSTLGEAGNLFPTAKVVGGWDFAGDLYNADDVTPIIAPDADPMDCGGHGSHVAGSTAGYGVNAIGTTYVEAGADTYAALKDLSASAYASKFRIGPGVAPQADLYSLRVFGCEGTTNLTEQAIEWAMDPNGDLNLSDHLDVINMSLGSSFGSAYDTSAVASNNAAAAGVIVVASSGNSNDVYYITGAPAVASNAISVASSVDAGAVVSAFEVTATTAPSPVLPVGTYPAAVAGFGPQTYALTGDLAQLSAADLGCTAYTAGYFTGKIALINRGTCTFTAKVKNAQNAGAIGVLLANNTDSAPADMGGADATITIPSMLTTKAIGTSLRTDMGLGTVTVLLTTAHLNAFFLSLPAFEDTVSTFSSRGPARAGTTLKPDISAPGETIFSTAYGTGNEGASFNGTSMAAPHVAGVMALLKQMHPTWTVAELKALVMNTATSDLWTSSAHTLKHTPTRVGAGRVSVSNAALSSVVAYNAAAPEEVSLSFGDQAVLGTQSYVKSITLKNTGVASADYNVTFDNYYQANPGLTFTLLDASDAAISNPVTVPAAGTLTIKLKIDADATLLSRARDASIATAGAYGARDRFSEGGGYVTLTSTAIAPTLRVPVHIAARPASSMGVVETGLVLPAAAAGTLSLTLTGTPVDTADDTSLVDIMELMDTSPDDVSSTGPNDAADLKYVGATSDYPVYPFTDPNPLNPTASMYFGVATYGKWDTPNATEFDVYIDVDEDGIDDYVVFNTNEGFFTGTTDDVMASVFCSLSPFSCDFWYYPNGLSPASFNTNLFNNNVMTLVVPLQGIGLVDGVNTDFDFHVVSYNRDAAGVVDISNLMSYDVANQAFNTVAPNTGMPTWFDVPATQATFVIGYDKAAIAASHSQGLLLLHHHNTAATTAEVLEITTPFVGSILRANASPTAATSVDFTVNFSTSVLGLDIVGATYDDFELATTGVTGAAISGVVDNGGGTYTVTVNRGTGNGTVGLNIPVTAAITDLNSVSLVNLPFTGEVYSFGTSISLPSPWVGSVSATSDKNIVAVGRPHAGVEVASYDGFSQGALTAYVPMLFKNAYGGTYDAALYIQNVDSALATYSIKYYNSINGALTCTVSGETVAPLASKGYWLPGISATCLPDGWIGSAVVTSDKNIVANGRPHIGAEVMTYDSFSAGSLTSSLPMLFKNAYGGSYDSAFYVQNVDPSATAALTIKYYKTDGTLTCTVNTETVLPLASKGYWLPGLSAACLPDGWIGGVEITSTAPIVTVGRPHIGSQVTTYNGFSADAVTSYVPMLFKNAYGGSYDAALYVQNLDALNAANITIEYYDLAGNLTCTVTGETVAAHASNGYWLPSVSAACLPDGWIGGAVVSSDTNIVTVGRPHVGAQVTTYGGFTTGNLSSYMPMLFKNAFGGTYNSAFYIQNTEPTAASVTTNFYDSTGALICARNDFLAAHATLSLWTPSLTCVAP